MGSFFVLGPAAVVASVLISFGGWFDSNHDRGMSMQGGEVAEERQMQGLGGFFRNIFGIGASRDNVPDVPTERNDGMREGGDDYSYNIFDAAGRTVDTDVDTYTTVDSNGYDTNDSLIALSYADLLAIAGDDYADGTIPLGDNKYSLDGPKKGYIYYCNLPPKGGGANGNPSWINGTTWNFLQKPVVDGTVFWSNATFSNTISGTMRLITSNGLPGGDPTGNYPIASNDDAYQYDRNPHSIEAQSYSRTYTAHPVYAEMPNCVSPGEVGMMLNGVVLYDGFDAAYRDAPAHEVQDSCDGHPHSGGVYHYHNLSSCVDDGIDTVIGYANDGFPITGPVVEEGRYLTTEDLDVCHGITSEVTDEKGNTYTTYHYVLTYDFPYSVGCYRGTDVSNVRSGQGGQDMGTQLGAPSGAPSAGVNQTGIIEGGSTGNSTGGGSVQHTAPSEAIEACVGLSSGGSCNFTGMQGETISGTCGQTPDGSVVCMPEGGAPGGGQTGMPPRR